MRFAGSLRRLRSGTGRGTAAVAQTAFARFAIAAMSVVTGVLTARVLGAAGRGDQAAMLLWPTLLAYLSTLGLPSALRFRVTRDPDRRSELFTVALAAMIVASIFACAIGLAFIPTWLHNYPIGVVRDAQYLMVFAPEIMIGMILTAMLETLGAFAIANAGRYVATACTLLGLLILAASHRMTPFAAALTYSSPQVAVAGWTGWYLRAHVVRRSLDPRPALRALMSYGLRSYGIDVLGIIAVQVDQLFVVGLLAVPEVGLYAVALSASRVIVILHGAVVTVLVPRFSGLEREAVLEGVGRAARISTLVALPIGAGLAALLPILMPALYGGAFARGVAVAQLLTFEAVILGLLSVLAQAFMMFDRPGLVTVLQLIGLAVVIPLMGVLIPRFGLLGAGYALLAATLWRLVLVMASFPLVLHVPAPQLIPTPADVLWLRAAFVKR